MARKRKNRTHLKGVNRDAVNEVDASAPKSFVIKSGIVGHSVTQLVRDIRKIMEPHTASRLRERASARLRDYLAMAPALKVSHLMALTLSPTTSTVHMRVARLPAGPTLTFRVERYSLMKDLTMAKSKYVGHPPSLEAFRTPPLLVLSNFNPPPGEAPKPQLKLMSTMFQGMFPPIQIDKSALPSFRRVLLISYHTDSATLSLRHYIITIRATGVSRRVRRVLDASATSSTTGRKPLDLTNDQDISDYLLGLRSTGYDTASESEGDSEAEGSDTGPGQSSRKIELPADYGRSKKGETKAVRLVEVGPRIEMKLGKVVEGVVGGARGEGETVWHERIHKSASEKTQLKSSHATKAAAKAARRAEQEANVARKKAELAAKEALKTSKRGKRPTTAEEEAEDEGGEESDGDEVVHDYEGEDEFEFEDRVAAAANNNKKGKQAATSASDSEGEEDVEDEDGMADWDGDEEADEGSSEEDEPELDEDAGESSDEGEEVAPRPARPRPTKKVRK